ncbi:MAG: hypothetical protein M0R03_22825 [Novosphingobium sp.]|nr:hypothetical protein [Novosphingobium sp.]
MKTDKGYILTITTIHYVMIFILFLTLTTFVVYRSINTDKQIVQNSFYYNQFNSGESDLASSDEYKWCNDFFYYDFTSSDSGYNNLENKTYCEGYSGKRFI